MTRFFMLVILVSLAIICSATLLALWAGSVDCNAKWADSNIKYKWDFYAGCLVNPGSGWIPSENYRVL